MAVQHHKTPAFIRHIVTIYRVFRLFRLTPFPTPCLREVMKLALAIMCEEDYYQSLYNCQTEQKTAPSIAS